MNLPRQSEKKDGVCPDADASYRGMKRSHYWGTLAIILLAGILWTWLNRQSESRETSIASPASPVVERSYPVMGTLARVTLYGDPALTEKAADKVRDVFFRVQDTCSIFDPESELSRLNASAADKPFRCSPLLWLMLQHARRAYQLSDGSFDITARPLMQLWGFYRERGGELPDDDEIEQTLKLVGLDKVVFDEAQRSVTFTVPGMSLDLGGIAKGVAVDLAAEEVVSTGVRQGVIDLGGNMFCLPSPPDGRSHYTIGIRDPLRKGAVYTTVQLLNRAVATSGNYERYVSINDKQYAHIMNPRTGRPVERMLSVTVVAPKAGDTDILSTAVFINGIEFARKISEELPHTSFLIIKRNKNNPSETDVFSTGIF